MKNDVFQSLVDQVSGLSDVQREALQTALASDGSANEVIELIEGTT